jgi:hypothetical protein
MIKEDHNYLQEDLSFNPYHVSIHQLISIKFDKHLNLNFLKFEQY